MSISTENFVKTVYSFEKLEARDTKPGSVAKALGITNAAATDMARKLAIKKLIHYQKYQQLKLTQEGEKLALKVLRKHRLWESFLHKVFDLSLLEIHREAELLEHQTSDFMAEKISQFLGNPSFDPHGDPIPAKDGKIKFDEENIVLFKAEPGNRYKISRLVSSDEEFFKFCESNQITIGTELKVVNQYLKNKLTEIMINDAKLLISSDFASRIYIKILNK